ncbi:MAG TPA: hypothetical protein VKT53_13955 [Candidatus Acidoferrum sp.]|nr:hypothetical protein [Candidatus Acidoferrum sp.]
MVTAVREFSFDQHLLDRLRYCGMERENLADLVSIVASLKNKYGIQPFTVSAVGSPIPTALLARYNLQATMLNKLMNLLLDTPRLAELAVRPYGYPRATQFELQLTLGD